MSLLLLVNLLCPDLRSDGTAIGQCNIDGASRGNPGPSSSAFCTRDHFGNLVVAKDIRRNMETPMECGIGGESYYKIAEICINKSATFPTGRKYAC
ncbi:hypothetical protein KY284_035681 [Solanum tuberosum]|nr:hypothetical protein KY284_035681 [Solanum tuberosum]